MLACHNYTNYKPIMAKRLGNQPIKFLQPTKNLAHISYMPMVILINSAEYFFCFNMRVYLFI